MKVMSRLRHLLAFALLLAAGPLAAESVHVAVASNFVAPMERIARLFEDSTGHTLKLSSGSSGRFATQIRNGAPFEVFLSADSSSPAALESEGLGVAGSRYTYALGRLVLWSARAGVVDAEGAVLRNGSFNKLSLANPKLAPYGAAAEEVLRNLHLVEATRARWVMGENIAQAYQFVFTGNADLGFVALSQVMDAGTGKPAGGSWWLVPPELHDPIRQDILLLQAGRDSTAAQALLQFMRSAEVRSLISDYGYGLEP